MKENTKSYENYDNSFSQVASHSISKNRLVSKTNKNKPIALSFFSGAMGLDLGIERAGFEIKIACEIDKYCRETIALNKKNIPLLSDIREYNAEDIRRIAKLGVSDDIDLIVGGPPCQAFSTAGKRKGLNDAKGNVFLTYLNLCLELRPKYFIIENVRGLLSCPMDHRPHDRRGKNYPSLSEDEIKGGAMNFIINILKKSEYKFSFNLYNCANFGTPQIRERVVIIASRNGIKPPYLIPTHSKSGEFNLPKWRVLESCISNINKHHYIEFPEKRIKYYKLLKPGEYWKDLPTNLQMEAMGKSFYSGGGKTGFLRRLAWDKPSPTLVTHPAMPATDLAHPIENRPLSIEEYKRIQEFPDNWKLSGSLLKQYKQIGNAVPLSLGFAIGKLIIHLLEGDKILNIPNFKYSRYKNTRDDEWIINFQKRVINFRNMDKID